MGLFERAMRPSVPQSDNQRPDARQGFRQMQQDPAAFFRGLNPIISIPEGMRDPWEIAEYLHSSRQISEQAYNMAMQLYKRRPH